MTTMGEDLPPEMQAFARLIDAQPLAVQEAFQFCLAIAMQEAGKFELIGVTQVGDRIHYAFRSIAGDVFTVVRPKISKEVERNLREELREILQEEGLL